MTLFSSCGRPSAPAATTEQRAAPLLPKGTIVEAGEDSGKVQYRYEDFLLEGTKGMAFCAIKNGKPDPPEALSICHDTLYVDSSFILMGHLGMLNYEGLYKRYQQKYHASEFPADEMYQGPLAAPDFTTDPTAREFKTRIREGCKEQGVNFGGHYSIIYWGCGMECDQMSMVDRINGNVYFCIIPFDKLDGHHGLAFDSTSYLLEVNTAATDRIAGYSAVYWRKPATYLWNEKGRRFELLQILK